MGYIGQRVFGTLLHWPIVLIKSLLFDSRNFVILEVFWHIWLMTQFILVTLYSPGSLQRSRLYYIIKRLSVRPLYDITRPTSVTL